MRKLHFCLTMDCERILDESPPGGPEDWESSRSAIEGFVRILQAERMHATFFIVPETAAKHADLWQSLDRDAFELGLHLHPQSLGDRSLQEYLGAYSGGQQRSMIQLAMDIWSEALGRAPRAFRPGNFSANDATFRVLKQLGFTHGSVSAPGRRSPRFRAVWSGAPAAVHRAHAAFRLVEGDMDFVEAPVTEDLTRMKTDSPQTGLPRELRVEWDDEAGHALTIRNALDRMLAEPRPLITIVALTHNHVDYSSDNSPAPTALKGIIRHARAAASANDLELVPATIGQIRDAYLENEAAELSGS